MDNAETIQRQLRQRILSGDLPPGARVPSELELVRQLGVKRSQTRQALQQLEKDGLIVRRRGSGSYVCDGPRHLIDATDTVKIVLPEYESRYVRTMVECFMERMFAAQKKVTNYHTRFDPSSELSFLQITDRMGVAGIVMWLTHANGRIAEALRALADRHFPIVLADRCPPGHHLDYVVSDNRNMGAKLTRALIERGHERIAFVYPGDDDASTIAERKMGYEEAMADAGLPLCDELYVVVDSVGTDTLPAMSEALAYRDRPTAFVCINDYVATYVERDLLRLGWTERDGVALAYVDDRYVAPERRLPSFTIRQDAEAMGRTCAELLLRRMSDPTAPVERRVIPSGEAREWLPEGSRAERGAVAGTLNL